MKNLYQIYLSLEKKYKINAQWRLWSKPFKNKSQREEVILGAILTQRTNWRNVELAIKNLKEAKVASLSALCRLGPKKIAPLVRPAGFYQSKSRYLYGLARFIMSRYGQIEKMKKAPLEKLRSELLKLKGIGPETADSILLYALDKPVFVIDEYTRRFLKKHYQRFFKKLKISDKDSYERLQKFFENNLPRDVRLYQRFHALIVIMAKSELKGKEKR